MDLHISLDDRGDLAARIYRQILDAILDGRLPPGERVPPSRELAERLSVSRNTVASAYERLTAEGFLNGRAGAGTFVRDEPLTTRRPRNAPAGGIRPRRTWRHLDLLADEPGNPPPPFDLRVGTPDAALFPLETWRRLVSRELRPANLAAGSYSSPAGHSALREAIARYIGVSRAVRAEAEDIVVTQGAQQALDLIGRVLLEPGDIVAVEEPGYPPARRLFESQGARVVGVPVDAEGIDVAALPKAPLVYVTPSHQFPLGTPMSLSRRAALLAWAERNKAVIIEDDYDSEFRFSDRPLEPLQSLDRSGRVLYVGSFSKTLLPMLRVGFLVAPASLHQALHVAKQLTDWHGDMTTQGALARFINEGLLSRHIRKAAREYAARHEQILTTLESLPDLLQPIPSSAGLHLSARLSPHLNPTDVLTRARQTGVAVESLTPYCADTPQNGLVIGYGAIPTSKVPEALRRLTTTLHP
ncbi:PLP-dependent aminotransferase family protein [Actinomadura barringtoniae]|uniref:PLP-dependent aminotransferase family protein n=1 Tax=Actinomadura barringtoniae TaxID=1427535 RepID=A0A939PKY9_9ACTN|nr:PLP-dependent aminotransferase family protein [Actinomadura barringtoniae]MBO2451069.1 PLP-dependent aminotransferase family protein [Actinomadura barringtoniae]